MGNASDCPVNADERGFVAHPRKEKQLCDRVIADDAVAKLRLLARQDNPFFLAVGFRKPHLSFRFPAPFLKKFPDLSDIDLPAHPTLDPSQPAWAHHDAVPQTSPYEPVDDDVARQWRLYYRASMAWMDSQLGRVLDELDRQGLANDTLVVLHSDHGWSLGEHGEYQKFTNFEHGTRVPLIVRAPWIQESKGAKSSALAELVDVFPTIAEAAGVPATSQQLDGVSLVPILEQPQNESLAKHLKPRAISQYMRCPTDMSVPWQNNNCLFTDRSQIPVMGYTLRTSDWRYTRWMRWNGTSLSPVWDELPLAVELYSHIGDNGNTFDDYENANENASYPDVVKALDAELRSALAFDAM